MPCLEPKFDVIKIHPLGNMTTTFFLKCSLQLFSQGPQCPDGFRERTAINLTLLSGHTNVCSSYRKYWWCHHMWCAHWPRCYYPHLSCIRPVYLFCSASSEICSLPDVLTGNPPELLNGSTLLLVLVPACCLAGAVAVVGELTLGTTVEVGLVTETAVAHLSGETERGTEKDCGWIRHLFYWHSREKHCPGLELENKMRQQWAKGLRLP